ncbi:MAG: alpha/beta hydrolase [Dehalococcoidia bacterium]|nr:alpha/beta hydrolase [Dehalococcoidia bacterium]MCB9485100.1 alpha/beta hydrolase [Thermoflexaceae bacterium]
MTEIRHRFVNTNGIRMHIAEAGDGFPVVMCHGWPELWYSWRHQLPFLAANGFRAIAPDMRGYGETDAPVDSEGYRSSSICADIAGLLDALEIEKAVIAGHDWGGYHIWQFALRYPERTAALIGLNTPYSGPPPPLPSTALLHAAFGEGDRGYYMLYFQQPGQAEAELEADIRGNLAKVFHPYTRAQDLWTFATVGGDGSGVFTRISEPATFLSPEELDYYTAAFTKTGFSGGLNYYRAMDRNWEDLKSIGRYNIEIPTLMMTAENDLILRPEQAAPMREWIPDLRIELVRNCSHWTQQERPDEVNALMLDFLSGLELPQPA